MVVKFRYENVGQIKAGQIYQPIAKVTLQSPVIKKSVHVWMVVDTGADYTILPRHLSEKLRISLEKDCFKEKTFGIGGEQTIYFYKRKIYAKIGRLKRNVPLAFLDSNEVPALLGRLGFLETFDTEFSKKHIVVFRD